MASWATEWKSGNDVICIPDLTLLLYPSYGAVIQMITWSKPFKYILTPMPRIDYGANYVGDLLGGTNWTLIHDCESSFKVNSNSSQPSITIWWRRRAACIRSSLLQSKTTSRCAPYRNMTIDLHSDTHFNPVSGSEASKSFHLEIREDDSL